MAAQTTAVEQVGERAPDQHGRPPHGQRPEPVDDPGVEVGAQSDRRAHRRGGEVEGQQAGDGEVGVGAAAGERHAGAEHVDEQQGEQHRLDGDVGELQRLAGDVDEVAPGEGDDVAEPCGRRRAAGAAADGGRGERRRRWSCAATSTAGDRLASASTVVVGSARVAGEGEEHVVERRLVDLDVVHGDAGGVEGPHHGGGQARAAAAPAPAAGVRRGSRGPAPDTKGPSASAAAAARLAEGHLQAGPAGGGLELARRARRRSPGRGR